MTGNTRRGRACRRCGAGLPERFARPGLGCAPSTRLYDDPVEAVWYRAEYQRIGQDITALRALPKRRPGIREVPAGRTTGQERDAADNARRREMLAEFEVRAVLYPRRHDPRVVIPAAAAG